MTHLHIETPYVQSHTLGQRANKKIWLKLDALQPCGSFKARGMAAACQDHLAKGATSFVSSSGGNAGLAVAWAGRLLNVPVTVVVPESTKQRAKDLISAEGANVIVHGESWVEAHGLAMEMGQDVLQTFYEDIRTSLRRTKDDLSESRWQELEDDLNAAVEGAQEIKATQEKTAIAA